MRPLPTKRPRRPTCSLETNSGGTVSTITHTVTEITIQIIKSHVQWRKNAEIKLHIYLSVKVFIPLGQNKDDFDFTDVPKWSNITDCVVSQLYAFLDSDWLEGVA